MRRTALIAVVIAAALTQVTTAAAAPALTHPGAKFYFRSVPKGCFAKPPKTLPHRLMLGCSCPRGEVVARGASATYRFRLRAPLPFVFKVAWNLHKPRVTTSQSGSWSFVTVHGPRRCGVVTQVVRVTIVPT
jgi:hypothetical protein